MFANLLIFAEEQKRLKFAEEQKRLKNAEHAYPSERITIEKLVGSPGLFNAV
jgi:hypothetical protein